MAEELDFSRAAQRMHMAQPPLSAAIRQLERDLGVDLFAAEDRIGLELLIESDDFLTFKCGGDSRLVITRSSSAPVSRICARGWTPKNTQPGWSAPSLRSSNPSAPAS